MTNRSPSIIPHLREHKPRAIPTHHLVPSHPISVAPCAIPQPVPQSVTSIPDRSERILATQSSHSASHELRSPTQVRQITGSSRPALLATPNSISRPRKRFRKKANGLFGDQTELKQRMSKLIMKTDNQKLVQQAGNVLKDPCLHPHQSFDFLPAAKTIVKHLTASVSSVTQSQNLHDDETTKPSNSIDFVSLLDTHSNAVESLEKVNILRKMMGKLTPHSNEQFLATLGLGKSTPDTKKSIARNRTDFARDITPPARPLPNLESEHQDQNPIEVKTLSSKTIERSGLPAVLRCKTRRLDRGYRRADVLRARLQGNAETEAATTPSSVTSAAAHCESTLDGGTTPPQTKSTRRRYSQNRAEKRGRQNEEDVLLEMESRYQRSSAEQAPDVDNRESQIRVRKRRRVPETENTVPSDEKQETGNSYHNETNETDRFSKQVQTDRSNPEQHDQVHTASEDHTGLEMLVEAATGRTNAQKEGGRLEKPDDLVEEDVGKVECIARDDRLVHSNGIHEHHAQIQRQPRSNVRRTDTRRRRVRGKYAKQLDLWRRKDTSEEDTEDKGHGEKR